MDKFIDIHNHLIPKFDDGPKSFEESIEMLHIARDQGITDVFATSHFNEYIPKEVETEYFVKLKELRERAVQANIEINIHSGSEIFYHHYVKDTVKSSRVTTLGDWGQYVLIEFPMFLMPEGIEDVLFHLSMDNYIPIIAHPERYSAVIERPKKSLDFIRYGGYLQINAGSILGHFGKDIRKISMHLLEQELAFFIASDAHTTRGRTFIMREVYDFLQGELPEEYLTRLLYENPQHIIQKNRLSKMEVSEPSEPTGFFARLKNQIKQAF